jgi:hypothetical protein
MSNTYNIEYTDTFGGEANYSWVHRTTVRVPEITHYGYTSDIDGGSYAKANRAARRELMRRAKAEVGLTGVRGVTSDYGDMIEFRPYGMCTILFATYADPQPE